MEQEYFYLTVVDENDNYDIHQLKKELAFGDVDSWQKGDIAEDNPSFMFEQNFLYVPASRLDYIFNECAMGQLMNLPNDLTKTLNFIINVSTDFQCHGVQLSVDELKSLATLGAGFKFHAKLHIINPKHLFPFSKRIEQTQSYDNNDESNEAQSTGYAHFGINSYSRTVGNISDFLGLIENDHSFSRGDSIRTTERKRTVTQWGFKSILDKTEPLAEHIQALVDELYPFKDKILSIGNEIDCSYGMSVTGYMPDEYELEVSLDTLRKLAEMRITLDFDMYFLNNY